MAACRNATAPGRPERASGLLHPDVTAGVAHLRRDHRVSAALVPYVERYWSVSWQLPAGSVHRAEVLSDPAVNLSVETGTRPRFGHELPAVLVHGVVTRRFAVDLSGSGRVSAAKFRPGGFTALTGRRVAADTVTPLAGAPGLGARGLDAAGLLAAVLAVDDDAARAAALDAALAADVPEPDPAYLDLLGVLDVARRDADVTRVDRLAARAGTTVRALQRLFSAYVGVGPKAVLARFRLQDAAAAIDAGEVEDLAGLAASLGWADQAHFSREFRAVVGVPPSAYLRRARADAG